VVTPGQIFLEDEEIKESSIKNHFNRPVKLRASLIPKFEAAMKELGDKAPLILEDIRTFGTQKMAYDSGKKGVAPPERSFHVKGQAFDISQNSQNKSNIDLIKQVFSKYGFKQHPNEWWHFSFGEF